MAKKTPFYDKIIQQKGKIVEFAGFLMPVQFEGIIPEHKTVRRSVGVFDVSHMGEVEISGEDRIKFVNYIITNDASKLTLNQVLYTTMLYPDGGIVDDLLVYNLKDRVLLVVNASNTDKDFAWIMENKKYDVDIKNISDKIGQLAIQGPQAEPLMQKLFKIDLSAIAFYWATETDMSGIPVILSRTGYTGEDGFELYLEAQYAADVWDMVFSAGKEFDLKPVGLGARDTLRFELRYCLYGNDIDKTTNPLEAGLGWVVKLDKEEFIGKDVLVDVKKRGVQRKLVGFEALAKGIPRHNQEIHAGEEKVGFVTSGTFSPSLEKGIGMGYVNTVHAAVGNKLKVMGKEPIEVEIIKGPFYKHGTRK